ncbi:M48 family metallopeptidase [Geobacter sp. SVR]|uniref:M48 family metallopeptidase n=1 Tax=Geobacter sp. SVR TaxID=2495594 RepID=UPI00143EFCA9|nr:M48 family metallopeptidase [Geobacter sp. SVR]BCS52317.1 peptidase M48 [Geobacter sp. SVR]GCF85024.1 peptidase M48 [Geobacter sp. SVR]
MSKKWLISGLLLALTGCSTVPVTGRYQLNLIPASSMTSMSLQQYDQFLKEHKISTNQEQTQLVKRVGERIKGAVEQYLTGIGRADLLANYKWEFNLVEDKQVNAWCMPGGKVAVYTGILPITKDEQGLAVVLGHEISHAVAEHGNERMSQGLMAQLGGVALSTALATKPAQTQQLWMAAYGAGAQYGAILPFSRLQENEADQLGLIFMTMAGYDPNQAVTFWERMAAQKNGQGGPEFLSTHPADATRIERIKQQIPEVIAKYRK